MHDNAKNDAADFEPGGCVLELMGHRRLGGYVSEASVGGVGLIRIDIPATRQGQACTQFYAPAALYCLTPTTEAIARAAAALARNEPVSRYELLPVTQSAGPGDELEAVKLIPGAEEEDDAEGDSESGEPF